MRILVTGGAGFIGSHVVDLLKAAGHDVFVLDNLSTGSRKNVSRGVPIFEWDIRQPLNRILQQTRPEVVVHLAAQVSVPQSAKDPGFDLAVNVGGTINVMQAAVRAGVRKIVAMSSAAVYGIPEKIPISETDPLRPVSPYGLSKLTGEEYIKLLTRSWGQTYTIFRPANVYGPRQRTEGEGAVVPAFLSHFADGVDPVIHGDGSQTRDFVYVTDAARAIVGALTKGDGKVLNLSSGTETTIAQLWFMLASLIRWSNPQKYGPVRTGDITRSVLANRDARVCLDWVPQVSLELGLQRTIHWMQSRREGIGST